MKNQQVTIFHHFRHLSRRARAFVAVVMSMLTAGTGLQAQGPAGGVVRAGSAAISGEGTSATRIDQTSDRAIIDWRHFSIGAGDQVIFVQPSSTSATLNRVTGAQVSVILGQLDANGQVLLINPNGIVFGGGAQVNVGSLIATTSNISDTNFMAGRLAFDAPGRPGAGVHNTGAITAAEGGLVALVAPHVRNDGVIVARLGKVVLGSADTFTIDLYGDALINLALSEANVGQLRTADGQPVTSLVTNTGRIETAGGQTVLMTARNAKTVLDNLINMSGTIKADTAVQQGGRILLLGEGGTVDVTGTLAATGATGGSIQVLGDQVHLGAPSSLDASGVTGGGSVQVGGAYQGSGDTYRSTQTTVDTGATLRANAIGAGTGGQVVVWSDGHTQFGGAVEAKGGASGGDGGTLEVSGKGTLDFLGQADASAAAGRAGSLLLDPALLDIGAAEASTITRVLRTGTTATLQADLDINVNSAIFPGERLSGGGLNMTAGQNIHVNDYIVTDNGAINMTATNGTVTVAAGKAVFAGAAPITVNASGTLHTGPLVTTGALAIQSLHGGVAIDAFIDDHTGPVNITAAGPVDINQPIVNLASGAALTVTAGTDINVNAQVDGRGGVEGGRVTMTATRDLNVNQAIVTNNGAIALTATTGAITRGANGALVSGTAPLTLTAQGNITTGGLSAGSLTLNSSSGDVTIADAILNGQTGGSFTVTSARDVNVNAVIDGRGGVPGGAVNLTAARDLNVNEFILTNNGPITLTATSGTMTVAPGKGTLSGTAPITLRSAGTLTTGIVSAGTLSATSTGGAVLVNGAIDGATGRVDLNAAGDVIVNAPVLNGRTGASFTATGRDVIVNAAIDGRGGAGGGAVALEAARTVAINNAVITNNGGIGIAAAGAATMAAGAALVSGTAPIAMTAGGDLTTQGISGGSLAATSTAGSVLVAGTIDGSTGVVNLTAAKNVTVNGQVLNGRTGAALTATAGQDVIVNTAIDGRGGASGGAVALQAAHDVLLNTNIATNNGGIGVTAGNAATMAAGAALVSGTGAIALTAGGDLTTRDISGGSLTARSTAGSVLLAGVIDGRTGAVTLTAAKNVTVNGPVLNGRTGAALTATAGQDVIVNTAIDGRGGVAGGAVNLTAARDVLLNTGIVTNNGGIGVTAGNVATMAAGTALASGTGAIAMTAGGDLTTRDISGGSLTARSTAGSVLLAGVIDGGTGAVNLTAAKNVTVNGPVLNGRTGAALTATAGQDVIVNTTIDGRGGAAGGAVALQAAHDVLLNTNIATNNGGIGVTAGNAATMAAGTALASGNAAIGMTAGSDVTVQGISGGSFSATSAAGSVLLAGVIDGSTGAVNLTAAKNVTVNGPVLNGRTGAALTATAGQDILVTAQIDGTGGVAGGAVNLTAARDANVAAPITTNNGAIRVSATTGTATVAPASGLFAGSGAITLDALGAVSTGTINGGVTNVTSRGGAVTVTGQMRGTGGAMAITAASQVDIAQAITNPGLTSPLTVTAGTTINVNAAVGRTGPGVPSGAVTLTAGQNVNVNQSIETENAAIAVTATNGAVSTAAGKGLFAGSGAVAVTSGQTLNTGIVNTTGAVTFRSTGGAVNVNVPINPATGAVTINAATDVNVNQGIANPRTNAALSVTAGHDITVNAPIDGRDNVLPGPSGMVTLTAGNAIGLNEDITTVNSALSLTATAGAVTTAAGTGLFAGSGPIAVTSGATLNTGITSTTGALTFRSTNGGVNVNQPIDDTTGNVAITAGTAVNLNQEITNLKTGSNLTVTAGTDINVLAQVDGRSGTATGGTVTMTAGNNLNLTKAISTNNGAVTLTATNGSVVVPVGTEVALPVFDPPTNTTPVQIVMPMEAIVTAGNAAVSITSGGDFTLASPVKTTGALTITSTSGNVTTAAPIGHETGAVTLTAHNALVLNREVKSNNQAITLNAGAGGITVNTITDYDYTHTSPVNPLIANLTLNSGGNVSINDSRGITSQQTVSIDARGQIVSGSIGDSTTGLVRPQIVNLNADGGIVFFSTGRAGEVNATSSGGSINLTVENPGKLRVTTGTPGTTDCPTCNITVTSGLGLSPDVVFNAGGSVIMPRFFSSGTVDFTARSGDISLDQSIVEGTFTGVAGRDVLINALLWMGQSPGFTGGGPVSFTAGRDIVQAATAEIHVSNAQSLTFLASHDLTLYLLETLGAVNLTATTGNITLNNDIGPHIVNNLIPVVADFNPLDKGVASLTMSAPAASATINMQGARAEGNVVISTGGTLNAAKAITSVGGSVTITAPTQNLHQAIPIGVQNQVAYPIPVAPAIAPGPQSPLPVAPGVAANLAAGLPAFAEIPVGAADQVVGGPSLPGASTATVGLGGAPTAGVGLPGAPTGAVALPGTPTGAVGLPGAASASSAGPGGGTGAGSSNRPSPPNGQGVAQADGSSDPRTIDSAAALRTIGESCSAENGSSDTGLDQAAANTTATTSTPTATTTTKKTADTGEQKNATCKPAAAAGAGTQ